MVNYTELPLPAINLSSVHACAVRVSREVIKWGPKNYEFPHIISFYLLSKLQPKLNIFSTKLNIFVAGVGMIITLGQHPTSPY